MKQPKTRLFEDAKTSLEDNESQTGDRVTKTMIAAVVRHYRMVYRHKGVRLQAAEAKEVRQRLERVFRCKSTTK